MGMGRVVEMASQGAAELVNGKASTENDNVRELYWQSSEAKKLSGFMTDNDANAVEALNERISLLQKVNENENGY